MIIVLRLAVFLIAMMALVFAGFLPAFAFLYFWGLEIDAKTSALVVYSIAAVAACYWNMKRHVVSQGEEDGGKDGPEKETVPFFEENKPTNPD